MLSRIGLFLEANFGVLAVFSISSRVLGLDAWLASQGMAGQLNGLLIMALVFGFGGVSVLGLNLLNVALPGYLAYLIFSPFLKRSSETQAMIWGGVAGGLAVLGSALMVAAALALSGDGFWPAAQMIVVAHVPVALVEGLVVGVALSFLLKLKPALFMSQTPLSKGSFS